MIPDKTLSLKGGVAPVRVRDLSDYWHPYNPVRNNKFLVLYGLANLNDTKLGRKAETSRSTMNRYRRGIWIPTLDLQIKICKILSELIGKQIDTQVIWGDLVLEEKK